MLLKTTLFLIASLAFPSCKKQPEPPQSTNHLKELHIALFEYESECGSYPETLNKLMEKGLIKKELLDSCTTKNITYIPGKNSLSKTNEIILYTPPIDGEYTFMRIDGTADHLPETKFQELLKTQTQKK